jgi:hypothetical protein
MLLKQGDYLRTPKIIYANLQVAPSFFWCLTPRFSGAERSEGSAAKRHCPLEPLVGHNPYALRRLGSI